MQWKDVFYTHCRCYPIAHYIPANRFPFPRTPP
jgi:hypothetical protein